MRQRLFRGFVWLFISLFLVGCGADSEEESSGDGSADNGDVEVGGGAASLSLSLVEGGSDDANNSQEIFQISAGAPGEVVATLNDASGAALSNEAVEFSTSIGTLSPSNGTALTDSEGEASVTLTAGSETGVGLIEATADPLGDQGDPVTQSINFEVTQPDIRLGGFTDPSANGDARGFIEEGLENSLDGSDDNLEPDSSLSPGGSLTVTARLIDNDGELFEPVTGPVDVSFRSNCADEGDAAIDSPVEARGGTATATYTDDGCAGQDSITATADVGSESLAGATTFDVETAAAGSIEFEKADPQTIALRGTGGQGRSEVSTVSFIVLDENSQPVPNQDVDFALSTDVGGLGLSQESKQTNEDGEVSVRVQAGTISTAVRVEASFERPDGTEISTVSDQLIVSTGLPDNDSFSLSVERLNPLDAFDTDGREVEVTILAADHFNNPVPDGTAIAFETEGGSIEPSCTTMDGGCTVTWTSQDPRPVRDTQKSNPNDRFGRARILATAVGEEAFTDVNGNGRFDVDETQGIASNDPFNDLVEAFRDDNEDGSRTTNGQKPNGTVFIEEFKDFNRNGAFTAADGFYNGTLCTDDAEAQGHCGKLINVRDQNIIVMPTREIVIRLRSAGSSLQDFNIPPGEEGVRSCTLQLSGSDIPASEFELGSDDPTGGDVESQSFDLWFRDANCNAIPNGTQISLSTSKGVLSGDTDFEVGSTTEPVKRTYTIREEDPDGPTQEESAEITIEATNDESDTSATLVIPITVDEEAN